MIRWFIDKDGTKKLQFETYGTGLDKNNYLIQQTEWVDVPVVSESISFCPQLKEVSPTNNCPSKGYWDSIEGLYKPMDST